MKSRSGQAGAGKPYTFLSASSALRRKELLGLNATRRSALRINGVGLEKIRTENSPDFPGMRRPIRAPRVDWLFSWHNASHSQSKTESVQFAHNWGGARGQTHRGFAQGSSQLSTTATGQTAPTWTFYVNTCNMRLAGAPQWGV